MAEQEAIIGGGCFWCLEAVYQRVRGVSAVQSGYSGGEVKNPDYRSVCAGTTGHAEVVKIVFNPDVVSFRQILEVFFSIHDPTTLNRQGNDTGTQYRSIILYNSEQQKQTSLELIEEFQKAKAFSDPITTEVVPLEVFYPAEDYHNDYYRSNPAQPYCMYVVDPKVKKFLAHHSELAVDG